MKKKIFITGIGTEVGKTVVSAVFTEALQADYWKPIQSGDLHYSDTDKVKALVTNENTVFHSNSYALKTPMSPHASAAIDGVEILSQKIKEPKTNNDLVIEGAGGLLVPLNDTETILDLLKPDYKVVVVSRHYLGSINHTLMTLDLLSARGFETALVFNGDEHETTEDIIKKMSGVKVLGRIDDEPYFDKNVVLQYAEDFKEVINDW